MYSTIDAQKYIQIRHDLHQHPELQHQEKRTADIVASILNELGYEVQTGVGGTGVVALMDTKKEGMTIAYRADMDALPIYEENTFSHKSKHDGIMHACGHDGHTASLLCAAEALIKNKDRYKGKIKLIFQPAEENGCGAKAMIDDGVLESPKVDAIFGYHNRPGFKAGHVFAKAGSAMGGNAAVKIKIIGNGGHAAMPHLANDPIVAASTFAILVQSVVSRHLSPLDSGVITIASMHSGKAGNVIPGESEMQLSIRYDKESTKQTLINGVRTALESATNQFNCKGELSIEADVLALVNDTQSTKNVIDACKQYDAYQDVEQIDYMPTMGAEDFAFFLDKCAGCYFFIGNGEDSSYLHNPHYDFKDGNIEVAARVYLALTEYYLGTGDNK